MAKYIDAELFVAYMSGVKQKSKLLGYILAADEDEIIRLIKKQPAADVAEVKHGRWVEMKCRSVDNVAYTAERCSVCNAMYPRMHANYCPNCGSRMDEVEE